MARAILTTVLIVLLNILVSCAPIDSGRGQLLPDYPETSSKAAAVAGVSDAGEIDIVEEITAGRQVYHQGLELLVEHYTKTGNNMKLVWAEKELAALDAMPKYNYIIEAAVAGPNLKARTSIPEADQIYNEALQLEKKAKKLIVIKNENLLRLALDKYNQLIRKHQSSDKIDDAAYKAGGIYNYFEDYSIALLYYQRTYQWDPETIYPARFKAAYILDKKLHRRAEALQLYRQAVEKGSLKKSYKEFAENRIKELTQSDEVSQ